MQQTERVGEQSRLGRLRVSDDSELDSVVVLAVVEVILLWLILRSLTLLSISISLPLSLASFFCSLGLFLSSLASIVLIGAKHTCKHSVYPQSPTFTPVNSSIMLALCFMLSSSYYA